MPELPDLTVYVEALAERISGATLEHIELATPFLLRTVDPAPSELCGRRVDGVHLIGKRLAIAIEGELFAALHLMRLGRLHWTCAGGGGATKPAKQGAKGLLASLRFSSGTLRLTESGSRRCTSLHLLRGRQALARLHPGGVDALSAPPERFSAALRAENHTLKRALTDGRIVAGVGNAYSDEILHRAHLSPLARTQQLDAAELERLHRAARETLQEWIARLRRAAGGDFPERVTAFRDGIVVHGRYREPCPECGAPVQRIVYADSEANYCARCQTGGRVLADRALSRLLREDWPRTLDALE